MFLKKIYGWLLQFSSYMTGKRIYYSILAFLVMLILGGLFVKAIDPGPDNFQVAVVDKKVVEARSGKTSYVTQHLIAYEKVTGERDYFQTDAFSYDKYNVGDNLSMTDPASDSYFSTYMSYVGALLIILIGCVLSYIFHLMIMRDID